MGNDGIAEDNSFVAGGAIVAGMGSPWTENDSISLDCTPTLCLLQNLFHHTPMHIRQPAMIDAEPTSSPDSSALQSEFTGVAEVAVGEPVKKSKARDAVVAGGHAGDADHEHAGVELKLWNFDMQTKPRKTPRIRAAQMDGLPHFAAAQDAVVFFEDQFKR